MDPAVWLSVVAALGGAIVGAAGSVAVVFLQLKAQAKADRRRAAIDAAVAEWRSLTESKAFHKDRPHEPLAPLSAFILYHSKIAEMLEDERFTDRALRDLDDEMSRTWPHPWDRPI